MSTNKDILKKFIGESLKEDVGNRPGWNPEDKNAKEIDAPSEQKISKPSKGEESKVKESKVEQEPKSEEKKPKVKPDQSAIKKDQLKSKKPFFGGLKSIFKRKAPGP